MIDESHIGTKLDMFPGLSKIAVRVTMVIREFIHLRPNQLEEAIEEFPIAYVPLGSLEWHGPHIPLGFDGLKAEALLRRLASKFDSGVFFPTMYWHAFDVMNFPYTVPFKKYDAKVIMNSLYKMGFKVIIALTGHYPASQIKNLKNAAISLMKKHDDAYAIGIPEQFLLLDRGYIGDHAASGETSLSLELCPDSTDLSSLPKNYGYMDRCTKLGIMGQDPVTHASKERGAELASRFVERLHEIVTKSWDQKSQEPIREMYRNAKAFYSNLKRIRNLDSTVEVLGMDSKRDFLRSLKWMILKKSKMQVKKQERTE
ncbi:MAG: creatininase family protein [Promethearchaeota archaeon]